MPRPFGGATGGARQREKRVNAPAGPHRQGRGTAAFLWQMSHFVDEFVAAWPRPLPPGTASPSGPCASRANQSGLPGCHRPVTARDGSARHLEGHPNGPCEGNRPCPGHARGCLRPVTAGAGHRVPASCGRAIPPGQTTGLNRAGIRGCGLVEAGPSHRGPDGRAADSGLPAPLPGACRRWGRAGDGG